MEGQKEQTRQKEHVRLEFESNSRNEEFARVVAAVFMSRLDPTLEETQDVKTAVSEAVTNAIIHGYPDGIHTVIVRCRTEDQTVQVQVLRSSLVMKLLKLQTQKFA